MASGLTVDQATIILGLFVTLVNGIGAAMNNKRFNDLRLELVKTNTRLELILNDKISELTGRIAVLEHISH